MTLWPSWLRRWPAKPLGYARAGSNPVGVVIHFYTSIYVNTYYYGIMAEWLRRVIRNHLGFSRAGSNPADVDSYIYSFCINICKPINIYISKYTNAYKYHTNICKYT